MKLSRDGRAVLAATLWLLLPTFAAPVIAGEESVEPALTRVEGRAAQSKAGETAVIDEVLARVQRMNATVAELHTIIEAIPAQHCPPTPEPAVCPPATTASPAVPPAAVAPAPKPVSPAVPAARTKKAADDPLADVPWQPIAAGLAVLALLGLLWRQRRQKAAGESFAVTQPSLPPSSTKPTTVARKVSAGATPIPAAAPTATPISTPAGSPAAAAPAQPSPAAETGENAGAVDADLSLELAEVMLSMGLTDGAAQTLTDHIRAHPRQALFHWLKLLDVYRKSGMKSDFEKSAQEIQQHFNMAPPDWEPAVHADAPPPGLESYAHIISRVQELWPRRSCAEYLNRLLEDNRGGTRTGFPQPVVEEILLLVALLKELGR